MTEALGHVGLVVADVAEARDAWTLQCGIKDFITYTFRPVKALIYGKALDDCVLEIALGTFANGVKLEIIAVKSVDPLVKRFFGHHNGGVQHLNFYTDNYEQKRACFGVVPFEAWIDDARGVRRTFYAEISELGTLIEYSELPTPKR